MCDVVQKTAQLVTLAQQGDHSALDRLCSVYGERVRRIVRLRMGPELRSQLESVDLVQEALGAAVRDLGNFTYRSDGDFLRWLARIAENRIRDNIGRIHCAKRDVRRQLSLDKGVSHSREQQGRLTLPLVTTTPSVVLLRREELDRLERALDRLKPEYRDVILRVKIEGQSHKDVARTMGKSPAAVAMLLSRAIMSLTEAFKEPDDGLSRQ